MDKQSKTEMLRKIRDEIIGLKSSPLFAYRTSNKYYPVIGEGSHDAKIMFVGEAPGKNEALSGKPFCGAAGKILDKLLLHVGIERSSVYVTNIVKDRPPENRDPTQEEIDIYGPFLDRQIEFIRPKVIATLGRFSMVYIMKKFDLDLELEPISRAHGKAFPAKAGYGNINIAVLYHPCMAVYNPHNIDNLKKDFEVLKKML